MSYFTSNSSYGTLKTTWVKQKKYTLAVDKTAEQFGSFSISAAVRGSYNKNNTPWRRNLYQGVC
jgi:hypothetical protein